MGTEGEGMSELERLEELLKQAKFELPIGEIIAHAEHADINLESEIITQVAYEPSHKYSWMPADAKQLELLSAAVNALPKLIEIAKAAEELTDAMELEFGSSDDDSESLNGCNMKVTFGQLRRARAALSSLKEGR